MNPSSVVTADYSTVLETLRGHLANGTALSGFEMKCTIAVLKDAVSRMSTIATALAAYDTAAEIDSATSAVAAPAIAAAVTAMDVPTYTSSTVMDG